MQIIRKYEPDRDRQVQALLALLGYTNTCLGISSPRPLQNMGQQADLRNEGGTTPVELSEDEGGTND